LPQPSRHWLTSKRLRACSIVIVMLYAGTAADYLYQLFWLHETSLDWVHQDFAVFWNATRLAVHGHALAAYDVHQLAQLEAQTLHIKLGGLLPWLYPPTAWLLYAPFGFLSYENAAIAYLALSIAAFVAVMYAIVPDWRTLLVALAFPGIVLSVLSGQNGLLTATLAGLGLVLLERRPILAGICFGLLAFKPQVAALIPIALLCGRQWRALAACIAAFAASWGLALAWFGADTLPAFLHSLSAGAGYVSSGRYKLHRMPTFFVTVRMLHLPVAVAYAVQTLSALAAVGAVMFAWLRPCPHALRAAVLSCAALLVSPYLYDYDLTWYGLVIAWTCHHALSTGFRRGEREWLLLLWLMPEFGSLITSTLPFQFLPFITAVTLWLLIRRVMDARRASCPPPPFLNKPRDARA
jgi:hypothetical protein